MQTKWIKKGENFTEEELKAFINQTGEDELLCKILLTRGFTPETVQDFLDTELDFLLDLYPSDSLLIASERIIEALSENKKILIYGDYDCDGTIGTAILYKYLKGIGADVDYYIPNRLEEGYGLNKKAIDKFSSDGVNLIITVDNGITAIEEIDYIKSKGMDVIVTDHHEPLSELPKADTIIDFKLENKEFIDVCGATTALILVLILDDNFESPYFDFEEDLEMVTISTVADIVPLSKVNRSIVRNGLESINSTSFKHFGLKSLKHLAKLDEVKASDIGFRIAPMINAAGRLGETDLVMRLLLGHNQEEIFRAANALYEKNTERTTIESQVLKQALLEIEKRNLDQDNIIIVDGKNWHEGVIGIVASRIQEKWNKPVIIISVDENNIGHGSCRSIDGFNIVKALEDSKENLMKFGGHQQAAGLTINGDKIEDFKKQILDKANDQNIEDLLVKTFKYDLEVSLDELNLENISNLEKLQPYGVGNPAPVFKFNVSQIQKPKTIGKENKHLSFETDEVSSIFFNHADLINKLVKGPTSILAKPNINNYKGIQRLQNNVLDILQNPFDNLYKALYIIKRSQNEKDFYDSISDYGTLKMLERESLIKVFNIAKKLGDRGISIDKILEKLSISTLELALALEVLREAELLKYKITKGLLKFKLLPVKVKKDLTQTRTFNLLKKALDYSPK